MTSLQSVTRVHSTQLIPLLPRSYQANDQWLGRSPAAGARRSLLGKEFGHRLPVRIQVPPLLLLALAQDLAHPP